VTGARLLVATGWHADTADLGLDAAAVKTDPRGFIVVDDNQRTTNPRIFAAGDVSGVPQYVYTGSVQLTLVVRCQRGVGASRPSNVRAK
jgi:mercuric reductase